MTPAPYMSAANATYPSFASCSARLFGYSFRPHHSGITSTPGAFWADVALVSSYARKPSSLTPAWSYAIERVTILASADMTKANAATAETMVLVFISGTRGAAATLAHCHAA